MNQTRFELTIPDALALMNLAGFVCENKDHIHIVLPDGMDTGRFAVLLADFEMKSINAQKVLAKIDADDDTSSFLILPRDGIRWKDR